VPTHGIVCGLGFSSDGRSIAIGQQCIGRPESIVTIWQVADRAAAFRIQHPFGFGGLACAPDGRGLATGLKDGTVTIFEDVCARTVCGSDNQGSAVTSMEFLRKSSVVAAGDREGWVRFHGPTGKANLQPIKYPGAVLSLASSPDGTLLAVGGDAKVVQIYDLVKRELVATLEGHTQPVESLDFSSDGKLLASAGGAIVRLWDTTTWRRREARIQHSPPVLCVRFSPDAKILASSDGDKDSPHGESEQAVVILWNLAAGTEVARLSGHTGAVRALAFSPDGRTLASGSADQTVKLWDIRTGELRETIKPGGNGTENPQPAAK
jgi:WD40 repeat protein